MADKKLLEESTIRRFMELANIKPTEKGMLSESKSFKRGNSGMHEAPAGGVHELAAGGSPGIAEKKRVAKKAYQEDLEETVDEDLEEGMDEAGQYEEASLEEADDEGMGDEGGDEAPEMAGDEMGAGMEGGDIKAAFQKALDAFNELANSIPELQGSEVVMEPEQEADVEDEMSGEEEAPMMEKKEKGKEHGKAGKREMEEELEESIELVDDTLVEKLLQRVSARLVAEARKTKHLKEGDGEDFNLDRNPEAAKDLEALDQGQEGALQRLLARVRNMEKTNSLVASQLEDLINSYTRRVNESKKGWTKVPSKSASEKAKTKGKGPKPTAPFNKSVGGVKGLAGRGR